MKALVVASPVMTADERALYERRLAQRFEVGDRVVVLGGSVPAGTAGTVVDTRYEAPDNYLWAYGFGWLSRLLGRPEPQKQWHYQVKFDGHGRPGSWYSPALLEPEGVCT